MTWANKKYLISLVAVSLISVLFGFAISKLKPPAKSAKCQSKPKKAVTEAKGLVRYENQKAGFRLKYPKHTVFQYGDFDFSIEVKKLNLENFSGWLTIKKADAKALRNGEYGQGNGWELEISKKVRNLGKLNAQEAMIFSRFDVCNISFLRQLTFYHNGQQVTLSLYGAANQIISENPEAFESYVSEDQWLCTIWKHNSIETQESFYQKLIERESSPTAQRWFDLFDQIVETIEIY